MKKKRLAAGVLALAVSITACGCGEQVYEMTEDEEAVIVHYAAHAVSKFNKKQPEGVEDVTALKAMMEMEAEEREKEKEQEQQKKEEQKKAEQKQDDSSQAGNPSDGTKEEQKPQKNYVSLSKALGLGKIKAVYRRHEIAASYQASQSYMIRANSGNELLILHVNLRNDTDSTARCNILSKMPTFRLTVNGELSVSADTTILLNDLGTYQGSIKAGKKAGTVLVFQVPQGAVRKTDSMELEVTIGDTASLVQLTG